MKNSIQISQSSYSMAPTNGVSKKIIAGFSIFVIGLASLGILMVSLMAFVNPQGVMDLVHVKLTNNDAFSSIRGVYGGAGMTIVIALVYLAFNNINQGLAFTAILCGLYCISRIITNYSEGALGVFGQQWMIIEGIMSVFSLILLIVRLRLNK